MAGHGAELASALGAVSTSIKAIATRVARAGLEGLYGVARTTGGSGDAQKKLDVVAVGVRTAWSLPDQQRGEDGKEWREEPLPMVLPASCLLASVDGAWALVSPPEVPAPAGCR
jgi:hypothetical protein